MCFVENFVFIILMLQEIADDPQIFVDGASRFDIKQGELGEWFNFFLVDARA